jgi:hypothetical protein
MVYVTKEIVKSLAIPELKLDKTEVAASIDALCIAASAMIDRFTDRPAGWFNQVADPAPAPTTRRFRGEGKNYLRIPRHVGTASIVSPVVAGSTVYENAKGWIVYNDGIAGSGNGPDYYPESGQGGFFLWIDLRSFRDLGIRRFAGRHRTGGGVLVSAIFGTAAAALSAK